MKLPVHVWSDIACPWCWIGKHRLEAALSRFAGKDEVELTFHSFELDPSAKVVQEGTYVDRLARKYGRTRDQAKEMLDDMTARAADEGLAIDFAKVRATNTFDAHRLLHFALAHGKQIAMKERVMRAYFGEGARVSDHDTLVKLASEVGLDEEAARAMLASDAYGEAVREDERDAAEIGINGVPFFVIGSTRRYGVSGAQPPEVLLEVFEKAKKEAA